MAVIPASDSDSLDRTVGWGGEERKKRPEHLLWRRWGQQACVWTPSRRAMETGAAFFALSPSEAGGATCRRGPGSREGWGLALGLRCLLGLPVRRQADRSMSSELGVKSGLRYKFGSHQHTDDI